MSDIDTLSETEEYQSCDETMTNSYPSTLSSYDRTGGSAPSPVSCTSKPLEERESLSLQSHENTTRPETETVASSRLAATSNSSRTVIKLEETTKRNKELEKENQEMKERLKELEEQNSRQARRLRDMEGRHVVRLNTTLQEKAELNEKHQHLSSLHQSTCQKLEQLEKEKQTLHTALKGKDDLEGELRQLSLDMNAKTKELKEKLTDLANLQKQCEVLENDCDKLAEERDKIQSRLEASCEAVKVANEELEETKLIAEEMHTELDQKHTQKLKVLKEKLADNKEACDELEAERNTLQRDKIQLEEDKSQLVKETKNLTQQLDSKEEECTVLTSKVTRLTAQLNALTKNVSVEEEKKQVVRSKLEEIETLRDQYLEQRDVARRSLAVRNKEKSALDEKVSKMSDRLVRFEAENKRLKDELNEANRIRLRFEMELNSSMRNASGQQPHADGMFRGVHDVHNGQNLQAYYPPSQNPPGAQVHPFIPNPPGQGYNAGHYNQDNHHSPL